MNKMGSSDLIHDPFYEVLKDPTANWSLHPGQLYWAHIVYPETHPQILKLQNYDPQNERNTRFTIRHYNPGDERHYPVKDLGLREGELYYVFKGKRRLVLLLGRVESEWFKIENCEECFLCAPIFSFKEYHSQEMVIKTQAFLYPSQFYLPPDRDGCPEESAIRFEMIQPIIRNALDPFYCSGQGTPVRLSNETYWILLCHLMGFMNGKVLDEKIEEYMKFYGQYLMEEFKKS